MAFEIAKAGWLQRQSSVLKRWKRSWFVLYIDGHLKYFETPDKHMAEDAVRMQTECIKITSGLDLFNVNPPDGSTRNCLFQLGFRDKEWTCCAESLDDMRAWHVALEQSRIVSGPGQVGAGMAGDAPPPYSAYPGQQTAAYPGQQAAVYPNQHTTVYPHQQTTVYPNQQTTIYPNQPTVVQQGGTTTVIHQRSPYPVQNTGVAYPGQVYYGSHPPQQMLQQPGTNVIYVNGQPRRRGYDGGDVAMGVVAGAALGSMMYGPMWW